MINKIFIGLTTMLLLQVINGCGGGSESSGISDTNLTGYQLSYPQGRFKSLILSFDDGLEQDRRLVELFNRYGLRGTFNLNSGLLGTTAYWREPRENYISASEVASLYQGHEVTSHTVYHPNLTALTESEIEAAVGDDQQALSQLTGYPITSLAYPFGTTNSSVTNVLAQLGITNARTVANGQSFELPEDRLHWAPTCHYRDVNRYTERYLTLNEPELSLFYIWGHSWELDDGNEWDLMESFAAEISLDQTIWYTTTAELTTYLQAIERIEISDDHLYNPEASVTIWVVIDGNAEPIAPGETVNLTN